MTLALVFVAGFAALSWEAIWQIEASLSIGVSALGTAITLASTMAGMAAGALLMGRFLRARTIARPLALYGALELVIGLSGVVLLAPGFAAIERLDGAHYLTHPRLIPLVHLVAIVLLLAPQTIAMGATIPLFGCIAREQNRSLSTLYASNTAGATLGVFTVTFGFLPYLGVEVTGFAIACANLAVAAIAQLHRPGSASPSTISAPPQREEHSASSLAVPARQALLVAFSTGLVSFGLEVAWFRALRAAFWSTTQSFGVLLISVLMPLALGARLARSTYRRRIPLGALLAAAAILALSATPLIERSDRFLSGRLLPFWPTVLLWTVCALATIGPSMAVLGICLPRLLDETRAPDAWGRIYAANTAGSVLGALGAGWLALPHLGFARTVWLFAGGLLALGVALGRGRVRLLSTGVGIASLALAVAGESGLGRTRVSTVLTERIVRIVDFREGPDSTYAVIDNDHGARLLMIDGFVATGEISAGHYMPWIHRRRSGRPW